MSETKKNGQVSTPATTVQQKEKGAAVYTSAELIASGEKLFGVPRECVTAAFKMSGKNEMTVTEAKDIIKKFMGRKVM